MPHFKTYPMRKWTYGAEHELGDYDRRARLPKGFVNNRKDHTCVNSNGVANDPLDRDYHFGGEINSPPTNSVTDQVDDFIVLTECLDDACVNYRSNLHIHVGVPGLRDDLDALKRVQRAVRLVMPRALRIIQPIPSPNRFEYKSQAEYEGAIKRWKRRLVSHQTMPLDKAYKNQMAATSVSDFFAAEVPSKDGRPLWHLRPRSCVNLRQLIETDTIEFRHFAGTLDASEFGTALHWCQRFLDTAINGGDYEELLQWAQKKKNDFPKFPKYVHWQETRYRATVHDGSVPRDVIQKNIKLILAGEWED